MSTADTAPRVALVTNATKYAGAPTVAALAAQGWRIIAHDASFTDVAARAAWEAENQGMTAAEAQDPAGLIAEVLDRMGGLHGIVSNDAYPAIRRRIEETEADALREMLEALTIFPFALASAATSHLKAQGAGAIVMVTSASPRRPYPGFAMYATARSASTGLAKALANELAPHGVRVNAVAPNFLYSETYYPRAKWIDDPAGAARVREMVPLGRLGRPEEIGELIAFLLSDKAGFVVGETVGFTGGWP